MTRLVAQVVTWLALIAVLVVAGGHAIYYLMNWEWSRAALAATGFVAALVMVATFLVLGRLQRIERRIDLLLAERHAAPSANGAGGAPGEPGVEPRPDFPWLARPPVLLLGLLAAVPRPEPAEAVFIPIFLAAGVIVSALAAGVERVAALVEGRRLAPGQRTTTRVLLREQPTRVLVMLPLVGVVVAGLTISGLYLASHYWSQPIGPGVTTMTVEVDSRGPTTSETEIVETVGRFCTVDSGTEISFVGVEPGPADATLLRLEPLLDDDAKRRYIGCIEDAVLEWHRLTVTDTVLDPA